MSKPDAIKQRLRTMFERRDRMAEKLVQQDARINAVVRELADAEKVTFLRVEAARRMVFGAEAAFMSGYPDRRPDGSGLDDGPYLPGRAPRRQPPVKSADELSAIRSRAWQTRRAKYGEVGHG